MSSARRKTQIYWLLQVLDVQVTIKDVYVDTYRKFTLELTFNASAFEIVPMCQVIQVRVVQQSLNKAKK